MDLAPEDTERCIEGVVVNRTTAISTPPPAALMKRPMMFFKPEVVLAGVCGQDGSHHELAKKSIV